VAAFGGGGRGRTICGCCGTLLNGVCDLAAIFGNNKPFAFGSIRTFLVEDVSVSGIRFLKALKGKEPELEDEADVASCLACGDSRSGGGGCFGGCGSRSVFLIKAAAISSVRETGRCLGGSFRIVVPINIAALL
jgi:hypothetical protein